MTSGRGVLRLPISEPAPSPRLRCPIPHSPPLPTTVVLLPFCIRRNLRTLRRRCGLFDSIR